MGEMGVANQNPSVETEEQLPPQNGGPRGRARTSHTPIMIVCRRDRTTLKSALT